MALLEILQYPDSRLRTVAKPVTDVSDETRQFVADMYETMYAADGIGLAATQVNRHERILVIDVAAEGTDPYCFINPEIIAEEGRIANDEGCLSVPEFYESVERAEWIRVRALNKDGEAFELEADGLLGVCIQHEMDHLEGKLFVDYLSVLKRQRIKKKLLKAKKREADDSVAPRL